MVTIQEVTCEEIPVEYVDKLPTESSGSLMTIFDGKMVNKVPKDGGLASKRAKRAPRVRTRPLAPIDLDTISDIDLKREAGKVYNAMSERGRRENSWFEKSGGVSGKWIEFQRYPNDKTAVGIKDITGCTVVMIISSKGVFMAHIWETFFIDQESVPIGVGNFAEALVQVGVDEFDRNVIEPLISGGHAGVGSLLGLIGTDQGPGQLHHTKRPTIVVITPHDYDRHGKVLRYQSHAQRLADRLGRVLYPNGYPDQMEPLIKGYDPKETLSDEERPQIIRNYRKIFRRAALEVTRRNELIGEQTMVAESGRPRPRLLFRGAWRLWVGPRIALELGFFDEDSWINKYPDPIIEKRGEPEAEEEEDVDPCLYWDAPPGSSSGSPTPASTSRALINTSTTPFGTSTTPTPTPTGLCSYEACSNDSECTLEDGATGFVSTGHVDCSDVPIEDVDHLPEEIEGSAVVMLEGDPVKSNHLAKRIIAIRPKPLRDLDNIPEEEKPQAYRREVYRAMDRLTDHNGWVGGNRGITAKWIPLPQYPDDRMAVGVRNLNGCNVVLIITRDGVYVAHIWEEHYFFDSDADRATSIPDFLEKTLAPLVGDSEDPEPYIEDTIRTLIGTDDEPGALHHTVEPHIFVITPWAPRQVGQAYQYPEQARYLANALGELIYPNGYPKEELRPIIKAYDRAVQDGGPRGNPFQKVILEMNRRNSAHRMDFNEGRRVHFMGLWRLWVGPEHVADVNFWKPNNWIPTWYNNGDEPPIVKRGDEEAEENAVDACPYWAQPSDSAISPSSLLSTEMMSPTTEANGNLPRTLLTTTRHSKITTKSSETEPAGLSG